jgi:hypothetical protein
VHGWLDKLVDSVVHWPFYRKTGSQRLVAFCAAAILQPPRHPMSTPLLKLVASTVWLELAVCTVWLELAAVCSAVTQCSDPTESCSILNASNVCIRQQYGPH